MDMNRVIRAFQQIVNIPDAHGLNDGEVFVLFGMIVGAMSKQLCAADPRLVSGYLHAAIEENGLVKPQLGVTPC